MLRDRRTVAVAAAFVVLSCAAVWFTVGGFEAAKSDPAGDGYYQRLAEAFLDGDTAIKERPPAALLAKQNPYDPAQGGAFRTYATQDASLFEGKYFYYWGPSPVVTVVIPARLLGVQLTETDVGVLSMIALVGVGCAMALLVARKHDLSVVAAVALAVIASTPFSAWFQLTRVAVYEASILFAAATAAAAALCFVAGGRRLLVVGGILAAVAMGARLEAGAIVLLPVGLALLPSRRADLKRTLAAVGAPVAAVLALLLAYNQARFGHPFEFGQKYVLGVTDFTHYPLTSVAYIVPSLYYYLWRRPGMGTGYPYFDDRPRHWAPVPHGYIHFEPALGALWTLPAFTIGITASAWLAVQGLRRRDAKPVSDSGAVAGALLCGAALVTLVFASYAIFHASQRFRLLFDVLFALGAVLLMGAVLARAAGRARRALVALTALAATASLALSILGAAHSVYPRGGPSHGRNDVHRFTDWISERL